MKKVLTFFFVCVTGQWRLTDVHCKVTSEFDPKLSSAFLEKDLPTTGCVTNATSRRTGAEVHVIHHQSNIEQNVELFINDYEKKGMQRNSRVLLLYFNMIDLA